MNRQHFLMLAGAVMLLCRDWIAYRKIQAENPDARFEWDVLLARIGVGICAGFGVGEFVGTDA